MRCDLYLLLISKLLHRFNPHTYMRCDIEYPFSFLILSSFNPHTYMRCDLIFTFFALAFEVSIHTPTWGVTVANCCIIGFLRSFNPHTYMRCDILLIVFIIIKMVSIHTPTWGVTLCWITYYQPASLINYYANRYYFFDFTTQNCSINKLIYWFLTPAKLLFFL